MTQENKDLRDEAQEELNKLNNAKPSKKNLPSKNEIKEDLAPVVEVAKPILIALATKYAVKLLGGLFKKKTK